MADNAARSNTMLSNQMTPHESGHTETDKQLHGLLSEHLASIKPPQGASIPRLLSPAPIGVSSSGGSGSSSQRTSPAPPSQVSLSKSSHFDIGLGNGSQPSTPKRTGGISRGLSLQLPSGTGELMNSPMKVDSKTPLTPKVDPAISYGSPASVLPRRSRGMDFSRAATHLHHSTIAEKPDPESSPIVGGRGISVPRRSAFDSPMRGSGNVHGLEQSAISSSVGSISMMDSGSESSSGDEDIAMRDEDDTLLTPQVGRLGMGLGGFAGGGLNSSPGGDFLRQFTAADGRNYRDRLRSKGSRKNSETKRSSNGWKYDWMASPGVNSPPVHRSIENNDSYFQREISLRNIRSRRESLSLGTDELTIEDSTPGSDENRNSADGLAVTEDSAESRKSVIRRAVTARRSQLIPKSKGFSRIRAALMEESAPLDMENRREAEVIRQVRERDEHQPEKHEETVGHNNSQPTTTASSPYLAAAATAGPTDSPDDMSEINLETGTQLSGIRRSSSSFSIQASKHGAGPDFWNRFFDDDRMRTPPPPLFHAGSSAASVFSEDTNMGLETSSTNTSVTTGPPLWPGAGNSRNSSSGSSNSNENSQNTQLLPQQPQQSSHRQLQQHLQVNSNVGSHQRTVSPSRTRSNTPTMAASATNVAPASTTGPSLKALGKRRRDDDLDSEFFKRRAVSPGLSSIAGSPILPPSPAQRDNSWWSRGSGDGGVPGKRETPGAHVAGERLNSTGSESGRQSGGRSVERRVGMQGMNEAGEGMSNMSIE